MAYETKCIKCGCEGIYRDKDSAVNAGCGGCFGKVNNFKIKVELCPNCYTPKVLEEEFNKQLPKYLQNKKCNKD